MSVEKLNERSKLISQVIPYTQIHTKVAQSIDDPIALAVWIYLLTKPKDWKIIKEHVKNKFKLGDKKIKSVFSYLKKHNLIDYIQERLPTGKMGSLDIHVLIGDQFVYEDTQVTGGSNLARAVSGSSGLEALHNKDKYKLNKKTKTNPVDNIKSLVPEWGPGHPSWEKIYGKGDNSRKK